jgi:hypothetical protein
VGDDGSEAVISDDGLPVEFGVRDRETNDQIVTVLSRWDKPRLYRSYSEYQRELATAYAARAQLYDEVVEHVIGEVVEHVIGMRGGRAGVLFSALLDARSGCQNAVREAKREARQAAWEDQECAWRSYAPNLAVGTRTTVSPSLVGVG